MEVYRIGGFQEPASWTGELFLLKVKPEKPGQQLSSRERVCLASVFHLKTKEDVIMLLERVFETWSADRKLWKARLAYDTTPLMQRPGDLPERTD